MTILQKWRVIIQNAGQSADFDYLLKIKGIVSDSQVLENPITEYGSSPETDINEQNLSVNSVNKTISGNLKFENADPENSWTFEELFTYGKNHISDYNRNDDICILTYKKLKEAKEYIALLESKLKNENKKDLNLDAILIEKEKKILNQKPILLDIDIKKL